MKIPHHEIIRAAHDAFEIHCNTGLSEVLVPSVCNSAVIPSEHNDHSRIDNLKEDCWVFKVDNGDFYCVGIPEKYKETGK